ncbi:MAG: hypothetical protein AAF696_29760 [Bacteroidota bacterium]
MGKNILNIDKRFQAVGIIFLFLSALLYGLLLYYVPRENFYAFLLLYTGLFSIYLYFCYPIWSKEGLGERIGNSQSAIRLVFGFGALFRLIALFALPAFSDDYFRFIWDGKLIVEGISPFLHLPSTYMEDPAWASSLGLSKELYEGMNSPAYFTIYPPVLQAIFALGAAIFPNSIYGSVLIMKTFVFAAEIGSMYLILRILRKIQLPAINLIFYAFNPMVIVELCGSLHFEALMIFYLLSAWYLLLKDEYWQSALAFAMAVCSKLLPLMLLPFLLKRLGWIKTIKYGMLVGITTAFLFFPILDLETIHNLRESVKLYFYSFEFNASIWYLVREIGYQVEGYNIIKTAGDYFSRIAAIGILIYALLERSASLKSLANAWLWAFLIYFSMATIVHPWYICTLLMLSSFSRYRFPLLWTILLPLTYVSYQSIPYKENLWLVIGEYMVVFGFIFYEMKQNRLKRGF